MSVVEFTTDDPDLVHAYNVAAHDEASNRYKPTSLKDSLSEIDWGLFGLFLQAWRGNAYFTELAERVERGNYEDFVDVARRYKARTPGGEWPKVQTALVALYGPSKRTPSVLFARARLARLRRARVRGRRGVPALHVRCAWVIRSTPGRSCTAWWWPLRPCPTSSWSSWSGCRSPTRTSTRTRTSWGREFITRPDPSCLMGVAPRR